MKNKTTIVMGLLLGLILAAYMLTFQVRFNQMAILTTFGKAEADAVLNADGKGARLYFKWPWPIQDVRLYDARLQILEGRIEEQQTRDKQDIIVNAFVAWRISDPFLFNRSLGNALEVQRVLGDRLRSARGEIGNFTFDELVNTDPQLLKLRQVEEAIERKIQEELDAEEYGIRIENVGIKRITLPESVTKTVFSRMRETRERLAQRARSEGDAIASGIRANASSAAQRIQAFAETRAAAIRLKGDEEAVKYYKTFQEDPEFAIFQRKLEALQETLKNNSTFLIDTQFAPFELFKLDRETKPAQ